MNLTLLFTPLLVLGLVHAAPAGDPPAPRVPGTETGGCHALLTEQECAAHLGQLAFLQPGPERSLYLAQHLRTQRERETRCACSHLSKPIIYYPATRQTALRF